MNFRAVNLASDHDVDFDIYAYFSVDIDSHVYVDVDCDGVCLCPNDSYMYLI